MLIFPFHLMTKYVSIRFHGRTSETIRWSLQNCNGEGLSLSSSSFLSRSINTTTPNPEIPVLRRKNAMPDI